MILQKLCEYYERKTSEGAEDSLAPPGFEYKEIPFVILLDRDGTFLRLKDTREGEGKQKRARQFLVPKDCGRTVNIQGNLLWDKTDYILGYLPEGLPEKERLKIPKRHQAFKEELDRWFTPDFNDAGIAAVRRFLNTGEYTKVYEEPLWADVLASTNPFFTFALSDVNEDSIVCMRPAVKGRIAAHNPDSVAQASIFCLLSGEQDALAVLHPTIKGVPGAQTSGAMLVSYNADAFTSFGKKQGANASIGQLSATQYTTALNHLLRKGSRQKLNLGDTTVVFWAEKETPLEEVLAEVWDPWEGQFDKAEDNPDDHRNEAVKALLEDSTYKGKPLLGDKPEENHFFVLGISPNVARLAIRFWQVTTVEELAENLKKHFTDMGIATKDHPTGKPLPLRNLLKSIAVQGKLDNVPAKVEGDFLQAILKGNPYPKTLLMKALLRCRAEQYVTYARACLIKKLSS